MKPLVCKAVVALGSGAVIGVIGLLGVWRGSPWLFASLGPSVALQASFPDMPISRPWNVAVGQSLGVLAGFIAIYATGAVHAPTFSGSHPLLAVRAGAAALAVALGVGLEFVFKASHAPGASSALLVSLGLFAPSWRSVRALAIGIGLVTCLGEGLRRIRKLSP